MSFDKVLGQESAKRPIRSALEQGRLGHAYLFSGPDGVGKTLLALELGKALLCRGEGARPCDECADCRMVDHGRHPDLTVVQAAEEKRFISIDQVRDMGVYLSRMPIQAERRVVVVREAERLREEAANCMLKTLEEPAPFAMLMLTASRPRALLPTIRSRCQEVRFGPLTSDQVCEVLSTDPDVDPEEVRGAAQFAHGSAGRAMQVLESGCLEVYDRVLDGVLALPDGDVFALSETVLDWARASSKKLEPQRDRVRELLRLLACAYRDALLVGGGGTEEHLCHRARARAMTELADRLSPSRAMRILDAIWEAKRHTDANAALGLVVDNLFVRIGELQTVAAAAGA